MARSAGALGSLVDEVEALGVRALALPVDVTSDDAAEVIMDRALAAFGRVDVLVNNAGGNTFTSPVSLMRPSGWEKTFELNVGATLRLSQAVLPGMIDAHSGSIVNVSSVTGLSGVALMAHYAAAKAAVISLTKSLALEVAADGIRVNALVPGWISTDLTGFLRSDPDLEQTILSRVPMGRWGRVEEVADGALFLASDASSFMMGQTLVLDGGLSAGA